MLDYIDWENDGTGLNSLPDHDDRAFIAEVKAALLQRDLSLDELANMRQPHKEKADATFRARMDRHQRANTAGDHNKLFSVANKSQMRIDVIAMDVETATEFAVRAGHIRSASNATVFRYSDSHVDSLVSGGSALGRAVREGVPGVVEKRGENVIVGNRVFTPLSVVR